MSTNPTVICIHGLAGAGKTTSADLMSIHLDIKRTRFAKTLKRMIAVLLEDAGVSEDRIERYIDGSQEDKNEPIPELRGVTTRLLMKKLGSEFRDEIYPELWVDTTIPEVINQMRNDRIVVIDDLRFHHEHSETSRCLPGVMLYIKVESADHNERKDADLHQSERPLPDDLFHAIITNDGTKDQLWLALQEAIKIEPGTQPGSPARFQASRM